MKPCTLIIHSGTNDLKIGVNTMRKVRKLKKVLREADKSEEIKIGFSIPVLFTVKIKTLKMYGMT